MGVKYNVAFFSKVVERSWGESKPVGKAEAVVWRRSGRQSSKYNLQTFNLPNMEDHLFTLQQALSLRRVQSLESLYLEVWGQTMDWTRYQLQTALDCCPKIRKLVLDFDADDYDFENSWTGRFGWKRWEKETLEVAAMFLKFEEVDLTWDGECRLLSRGRVWAIWWGVFQALPGKASKLKILTMRADLANLREAGVTVNMDHGGHLVTDHLRIFPLI